MPASSRARRRSSRQKRSCCVQANWSMFRCGRKEHSMPAPQTNWVIGSDEPDVPAEPADAAEPTDPIFRSDVRGTMRVHSSFQAEGAWNIETFSTVIRSGPTREQAGWDPRTTCRCRHDTRAGGVTEHPGRHTGAASGDEWRSANRRTRSSGYQRTNRFLANGVRLFPTPEGHEGAATSLFKLKSSFGDRLSFARSVALWHCLAVEACPFPWIPLIVPGTGREEPVKNLTPRA